MQAAAEEEELPAEVVEQVVEPVEEEAAVATPVEERNSQTAGTETKEAEEDSTQQAPEGKLGPSPPNHPLRPRITLHAPFCAVLIAVSLLHWRCEIVF